MNGINSQEEVLPGDAPRFKGMDNRSFPYAQGAMQPQLETRPRQVPIARFWDFSGTFD